MFNLDATQMLDRELNQEGGKNSTNLQAGGDINIIGVSYTEAKQIALDVYNNRALELAAQAKETAQGRVEEITDKIITKLFSDFPHLAPKLNEPGVQVTLREAQIEYAKTGDKELEERLTEAFIARLNSTEKSVDRVILDESIKVLPKLTTDHLNILAILTSLMEVNQIANNTEFVSYITKLSGLGAIDEPNSTILHLKYCSCCSTMSGGAEWFSLSKILLGRYKGYFSKGFLETDVREIIGADTPIPPFIGPCINYPDKLQLRVVDDSVLTYQLEVANMHVFTKQFQSLFNTSTMTETEAEQHLGEIDANFGKLLAMFLNKNFSGLSLTSVGYALGAMHYNKVFNRNLPYILS